jgi:hypothetical protein
MFIFGRSNIYVDFFMFYGHESFLAKVFSLERMLRQDLSWVRVQL